MKEIFIQFREWILKNRKRLVYGVLALFVGQICFFGLNGIGVETHVLAVDEQTQSQTVTNAFVKWKDTMSFFNKACNIFIYPMLVVAGYLVDNSFVYGEVFGFDAVLWQLWNIVKNLANFALGFLFLYKIFKYLIGNGKEKVKDILLNALIAGIGIQASWFIMAALIDISTILAYGVGNLPISVLGESAEDTSNLESNPYMMKTIISVDTQDMDTMHYYLTNIPVGNGESEQFYISECETFSYTTNYENGTTGTAVELLLAPKMIYYLDTGGIFKPTDSKRCHYWGNIYYFSALYERGENNLNGFVGEGGKFKFTEGGTEKDDQSIYKSAIDNVKTDINSLSGNNLVDLIAKGVVLEIGDAHAVSGVWGGLRKGAYTADQHIGLDKYNKWTGGDGNTTSRLKNVLDGNSYIGVFSALYASLVNSKEWTVVGQQGFFALILSLALEVGFTLAISIPLIVMSIVFMMRIGVLWLAIVLSPFIVLFSAFKDIGDKILKHKMLENLKLENLIPIIFSPAIVCFAISLCMVLVKFIQGFNDGLSGVEKSMEPQKILGGLVVLNVGTFSLPIAKIIISIVGVAITWFLAWAAIESSKLGKSKIVENLKSLATSGLGSIPIVPVPTKDGKMNLVGSRAVFGGNGTKNMFSRMVDDVKTTYDNDKYDLYKQMFGKEGDNDKRKRNVEAYKEKIKNYVTSGTNWTTEQVEIGQGNNKESYKFGDFEAAEQDEIIEGINSMNLTKKNEGMPDEVETKGGTYNLKGEKTKDGKTVYKYIKNGNNSEETKKTEEGE